MDVSQVGVVAGAIVAVLTALFLIWKLARFVSKVIFLVDTYGPAVMEIGSQFKKNGGTSLKDQIDRIEDEAKAAAKLAREAYDASKASHDLVIRLDENVRAIRRTIEPKQQLLDPAQL